MIKGCNPNSDLYIMQKWSQFLSSTIDKFHVDSIEAKVFLDLFYSIFTSYFYLKVNEVVSLAKNQSNSSIKSAICLPLGIIFLFPLLKK